MFFWVCLFLAVPSVLAQEHHRSQAKTIIANIEKLPRSERLVEYVKILKNETLSPNTRQKLVGSFAKHVFYVSPLYGKSNVPINEKAWISLFIEGWKSNPSDPDIAMALTQMLINQKEYKQALEIIRPFHEKNPKKHEASAWYEWAFEKANSTGTSLKEVKKNIPEFDVHFCVITKNPEAHKKATLNQLHKEISILNKYFHSLKNQPIVRFKFKSASFYDEVKDINCKLVGLGDSKVVYNSEHFALIFNSCTHREVRNPHAINFLIYDSYDKKAGYSSTVCHGKRNSNKPYILIDWERLNNNKQSPEIHEMGHAFGLGHVGVPGAKINDATNIMCSKGEKFGSGGKRNRGFTEAQTAIILYHAKRTSA